MDLNIRLYFFILSLALLVSSPHAGAQERERSLSRISVTESQVVLDFELPQYSFQKRENEQGRFFAIDLPSYHTILKAGHPSIPVLKKLISVPAGAEFDVTLQNPVYDTVDLSNQGISEELFPYQPSVRKDKEPEQFYFKEAIYSRNSYYSASKEIRMEYLGIARDVAIARIDLAPVQYNPVANRLKILKSAIIQVKYTQKDRQQQRSLSKKGFSASFDAFQKSLIQGVKNKRDSIVTTPAKYIVVADSMFRKTLQPFLNWKKQKGFQVVEAYTSDPAVGTYPGSIKSYILSHYNGATPLNPAPSYVLLVGDIAQIPAFSGHQGSHVSDLYYAEFTGDTIPDAFFGRFSATDTSELSAQIRKTLAYEKFMLTNPQYLDSTVLIAGHDGTYGSTHGNGQVNYISQEYLHSIYQFHTNKYLYPNSSSQRMQILQNLNDGFSIANYTAHGYQAGWANPQIYVNDLSQVNNKGQFGLMIGNACLTNDFQYPKCFGEAVLRLDNRGAIGYIGGSNNTYWDEDFYWAVGLTGNINPHPNYASTGEGAYDLLFHTHGEPFQKWHTSQGQMVFAGNMSVETSGSSRSSYYWEIYHLMGDPSLMPYLGFPQTPIASYTKVIPVGVGKYQVVTDPYATVALSRNDSLYGVSRADKSGNATINFNPFATAGKALLVITSQNKQPVIDTLDIINPAGPYILHKKYVMNDSLGNNNGKAEYGEKIFLDETIRNFTSHTDSNVTATISTQDTNITILDSTESWSFVAGDTSLTHQNAFSIKLKNQVIDRHIVYLDVNITGDQGSKWNSRFKIKLHAPYLKLGEGEVKELNGDGDGILESGETGQFKTRVMNQGSADASQVQTSIVPDSSAISVMSQPGINLGAISEGSAKNITYDFSIDKDAWKGYNYNIFIHATSGNYITAKKYTFMIGQAMEDFETGDFQKFDWVHKSSYPWQISDTTWQGNFAARSHMNLGDSKESVLSIKMNTFKTDSLSFYYKISSEKGYDFLEFWMDHKLMGKWSGQDSLWKYMSVQVPKGNHEFQWKYVKDYGWAAGEDCARLDDIIFPPNDLYKNVEENNKTNEFQVYPNPANDRIYLQMQDHKLQNIYIRDVTGRIVQSKQGPNTSKIHQLNVNQLKKGVYIIIAETKDGQRFVKKFIKR